jgi:hypothetical protein
MDEAWRVSGHGVPKRVAGGIDQLVVEYEEMRRCLEVETV